MAQSQDLAPVPYNVPMTDQSGRPTLAWATWFRQLFFRVGGNNAPTNADALVNPLTDLGDTMFGGVAGAVTRLGGNTSASKKFYAQTGTGSASASPVWSPILSGDVPILNQSTTGTASNITASSNSTLTTLPTLSLPGSQVSGNISGNAANVTGTVAVTKGGTGLATLTANNVILGAGTSTPGFVAPSTSGNLLTSNGSTWISAAPGASNVAPTKHIFTSSGTYTLPSSPRPPLYVKVTVTASGGGGGNGAAGTTAGAGGGGGGGTAIINIPGSSISSPVTVTVGTGVVAVTNGNSSSFGSFASATGGSAGSSSSGLGGVGIGGGGGVGSSGDTNLQGGTGGPGGVAISGVIVGPSGVGGGSYWSPSGGQASQDGSGTGHGGGASANQYGAGGGGGAGNSGTGGASAAGYVLVEEFYQ